MNLALNKRSLNPDDFASLICYGDPQLSPDGKFVAYVRQSVKEDEYVTDIYLAEIASGKNIQLTNSGKDRSPRWSSDGKRIAFISDRFSRNQIWTINIDGGEAVCLNTEEQVESEPVWSPDGKRIFYLARVFSKPSGWVPYPGCPEGDKERAFEQAKRKLGLDEDGKDICGSKKANDIKVITRLSYRMDRLGYYGDTRMHILYVEIDPDHDPNKELESHQVTSGDFDYGLPSISPDGNYLVTSSFRKDDADYDTKSDLWIFDIALRQPYLLYDSPGPVRCPKWSGDGKYISFLGHNNARQTSTRSDLYLLTVTEFLQSLKEGLEPEALCSSSVMNITGETDREAGGFIISDTSCGYGVPLVWDGSILYFSMTGHGAVYIYCLDPDSTAVDGALKVKPVTGSDDRAISGFHARNGSIILRSSTPVEPENLYAVIVQAGSEGSFFGTEEKRLTFDNDNLMSQVKTGRWEKFQYSAADGQKLDGWLIYPAEACSNNPSSQSKPPMAVFIHGGPRGVYGPAFMLKAQMFAGRGYAVSYFNPRGSSSYGQEFAACIDADWGNKDYSDIMDGVRSVVTRGLVDEKNLFVHGWSYGGYMTTWIVTQTHLFKAACAGAPVCNLYTDYGCTDIIWVDEHEYGGKPWEARDLYLDRSPVSHVANVETPILLVHGEIDYRCGIIHSEEFYQSLRRLGKTAVFIRYPGEYHIFRRPLHNIDMHKRMLSWFEYYRKQD
jgi:dipeptidyl aminopeptidase/acylaminoacyl peptidase